MSDNDAVLAAARAWAGEPMALATVVSTWGSAPRPVGSHLLVHADGRFEDIASQSRAVRSGDEMLVLPRIDTKSRQIWKDMTQILYQIAVSARVVLGL